MRNSMMKNKKKQLIKGIMLLTVLGLGWGVAGDISHAVGNELSQGEETPQWDGARSYFKGNIVTYNGIQYEALWDVDGGKRPDISGRWKQLNGEIPEWSSEKEYFKGDTVIYQGVQYKARCCTLRIKPNESGTWRPMNGEISEWEEKTNYSKDEIPEWNEKKLYKAGDIVTYNGIQYEAQRNYTWGTIRPGISVKWQPVDGDEFIAEWDKDEIYELGESVTYQGTKYEAQRCMYDIKPGESAEWKPVDYGIIISEWDKYHYYVKGDIVIFKGIHYKAKGYTIDCNTSPDINKDYWTVIETQ
ncbi:hypothetical protein CN553_31705 [Bacillus cereus]|uniref:Chitin-binding type-3 domain-containing protein n=2 Tax=Bacillus cereus TaxID=1396 RepID=A0A9X6U587_BACCE|nr:hypothetical protein CN553_31705 [Bacillus cereus]